MRLNNEVSEKDFLKHLALNKFNYEKGLRYCIEDFDIRSIPPQGEFKLGYELISLVEGSCFFIHLFLSIGRTDSLSPYRLKLKAPYVDGGLGDEVFVTTGTIDSAHHLYGGYPFLPIYFDESLHAVLLDANRVAFALTDGASIRIF